MQETVERITSLVGHGKHLASNLATTVVDVENTGKEGEAMRVAGAGYADVSLVDLSVRVSPPGGRRWKRKSTTLYEGRARMVHHKGLPAPQLHGNPMAPLCS